MVRQLILFYEIILFNRSDNKPIPFTNGEKTCLCKNFKGGIGLERGYVIGGLTVSYITQRPELMILLIKEQDFSVTINPTLVL